MLMGTYALNKAQSFAYFLIFFQLDRDLLI